MLNKASVDASPPLGMGGGDECESEWVCITMHKINYGLHDFSE